MDTKIQQELLDKTSAFMAQASHTLGQTVTHVYGVIVKQQVIIGITEFIQIGLTILILTGLFIWYIAWLIKLNKKESFDEMTWQGVIVGGIIGFMIVGLIINAFLGAIVDPLQHILNPEYFAIQFIFNAATGH